MNRYQHYIKDNKGSEYPYHYIFFDTETTQTQLNDTDIEHKLKLGVACYWRRPDSKTKELTEWFKFQTVGQFWKFVLSKCSMRRRIVILSHNLPFDMGIVKGWKVLDKMGYEPTKIILDYQCNIWRFRKNTTTLLFLDNMNYFQTSLRVLGDSVGMLKLNIPDKNASIDEWFVYCRRDVEVMLKAWQSWLGFLDDNDLGSFGMTVASQAFNAFRHRFMPAKIGIHTSAKATSIERKSYRGGRNECVRIGEYHGTDFYLVDVNSMYAYVMKNNEYPCNLISTGSYMDLDKAYILQSKYSLIAVCDVNTPDPIYGVKVKDKLMFPTGKFPVALTSNEIRKALWKKHIVRIKEYAIYERAKLFENYVDFFYNQRLEFENNSQQAYAFICKLMLNSLYGKFGQRAEEWSYVCDDPSRDYDWWQEYDFQKQRVFTYRCINHRVEVSTGYHEGFNSLVAVSSEVTANGRLYLWGLAQVAGMGNVYYMDTDSLIVNGIGLENLTPTIERKELGKLKIVDTSNQLNIHNLKDYSFGGKVKIKGIKGDAIMVKYNEFKQYQSQGVKTGLHNKDINRVIWREVTKTLERKYLKGEVSPDGRVRPLNFTGSLPV